MKRIFILFFVLILANTTLFGEQVDVSIAKNVGRTFLMAKAGLPIHKNITSLKLVYSSTSDRKDVDPETYYYVFNLDSTGFVIVSGTDDVIPILGYSTEGIFDPNNIPPNMAEVLNRYKREISYAIDHKITATEETKKQWDELISGRVPIRKATATSVSPLLGGIKWDQAPIYNDSCPYDPSAPYYYNYKCPAGCVATAMAQIIKYWEYPVQGIGSKCYNANYSSYDSDFGDYGILCADFENTTYNYASMPNELDSYYSTPTEKRAVAQLMYHCGVAVNMMYGVPKGSGAYTVLPDYYSYWMNRQDEAGNYYMDAAAALRNHFGYEKAEGIFKKDYTESQWINILKEQLSNWQPVLYAGSGPGGGHAFVCDGYDNHNFFHFNWGWGGNYNCYCLVSSLIPGGTGIGGGSGDFSQDQKAVINIKAVKDEKSLGWINSIDYKDIESINLTSNYFSLFPDTCMKAYTNLDSWSVTGVHGMGMTFDPYSPSFGSYYSTSLLNQSSSYRLDTLQVKGFYLLGKDGYNTVNPDTLRIYLSYYEPYSNESSKNHRIKSLSSPSYPYYYDALHPNIVKTGANPQKGDGIQPVADNTIIINYILTEKDTAIPVPNSPGSSYAIDINIPLTYNNTTMNGFEIPAGAVIGSMVKFIPGYNYKLGDTLYHGLVSNDDWEEGYPISMKSRFGLAYLLSDNADFADHNGYNGVNFETKELRYQMFNSYQDSCYISNGRYLPRMAYHISYDITPVRAKLEIDTIVCGTSFIFNGSTYTESGTYMRRFSTSLGDSIVVVNLTLDEQHIGTIGNINGSSTITQTGTYTYSIDPVEDAASYQWSISNPNWPLSGTGRQVSVQITGDGVGVLSVKAIHANGVCKTATKDIQIQSTTVGVSEYENGNNIQIYPNPVKDAVIISIENPDLKNAEVLLFDVCGKLLKTKRITGNHTSVDMNSFSEGIYVLQIKENEKLIRSSKVVKIK